MRYQEIKIPGAYLIEIEPRKDECGFFARTWCQREFQRKGLDHDMKQCNLSYNHQRGTLRGLHLQLPPFAEAKVVRCFRGSIFNVIVDLRLGSPTYLQWLGIELNDENFTSLYVPHGLAHGFLTLYDETEVFYQTSEFYDPEYSFGIRWNDPMIKIQWPAPVRVISAKDKIIPDFDPNRFIGVPYKDRSSKFSATRLRASRR